MEYKISSKLHITCLILSLVITWIFYDYINYNMDLMSISPLINYPTNNTNINFIIVSCILISLLSLIHELIHGMFYKLYGGTVKIGFRFVYAYTKETSNIAIESSKFIVVLLSPLFLITLLSLIVDGWIGGFLLFFNLIGSTGDIVMTLVVLKYGKNKKIIDCDKGFMIV